MDLNEGGFGNLPPEIIERVLSLLRVPDLCRCRSVCKLWRKLLCKPSFHNLRDLNGEPEAYLFLTRYMHYDSGGDHWKHRVDPLFRRRTTFLDVDARRWYTIKADGSLDDELEIVSVSMCDGLVSELARLPGDGGDCALFVADPVANTRRELPALPTHSWADEVSPTIVLAVDYVARSFIVYFVVYNQEAETELYVYESSSSAWRGLPSPPKEQLGLAEVASAVVFHGILYVVFNTPHPNTMCSLLSYDLQEDMWRVLKVSIPRCGHEDGPDPQVFVSDDELWMSRWYPNLEYPWMEDNVYFEAARIRISNNSSVEVEVSLDTAHEMIEYHLDEADTGSYAYIYPYALTDDDCDEDWDPIIWMSERSGKMIMYEFESDWVDILPAHPVGQSNRDKLFDESDTSDEEINEPYTYYHAWYMNLSMRNILLPGPVTIDV